MTTLAATKTSKCIVNMGQIVAGRAPDRMQAILGSCIGLVLYHPRLKLAVFAHIVLPESAGRPGSPGKFADTAVPEMLGLLKREGLLPSGLIAKFAGGANMFGGPGPLQIGNDNAEAVTRLLQRSGIRVVGQNIGGTSGRRVVFDCANGTMTIECSGQSSCIL